MCAHNIKWNGYIRITLYCTEIDWYNVPTAEHDVRHWTNIYFWSWSSINCLSFGIFSGVGLKGSDSGWAGGGFGSLMVFLMAERLVFSTLQIGFRKSGGRIFTYSLLCWSRFYLHCCRCIMALSSCDLGWWILQVSIRYTIVWSLWRQDLVVTRY